MCDFALVCNLLIQPLLQRSHTQGIVSVSMSPFQIRSACKVPLNEAVCIRFEKARET